MLTLLVCAVVLCLSLYYILINYSTRVRLVDKIPGPSKLPFIGNIHQTGQTPIGIFEALFKYWREFGKDKFRLWIGNYANIVISDAKDIEAVLTNNTFIDKSDIYDLLHPWLGKGLLTSTGNYWRKHRKMITPSFHFKILVDFVDIMNINSTKFIQKLREVSTGEKIFDIQNMVQYVTLDIICETAMGVSLNAMENNESDIVKAIKYMCFSVQTRTYNPFKRSEFLFKFMPEYKQFKEALKVLEDFTYNVIRKRQASLPDVTSKDTDQEFEISKKKQVFLDTLLTATVDNESLTLREIYEEVSTFVFEGHDTTTSGISFAIFMLSRHPEVQKKVLNEQLLIMGTDKSKNPSFEEISEMKYLEKVLKESQRLYPSVPMVARYTDRDYNINGTIFPKGVSVNLFIMAMGYNEKYHNDPYKFNPDRFDPEKTNKEGHSTFEYVPFSAGPRNCIGQKFAMMEMKSIVGKIVRNFEILPPLDSLISRDGYVVNFCGQTEEEQKRRPKSEYDPILSSIITLRSENGIQIRLRERGI